MGRRSLLESRYEVIAAKCAVTSDVSLLDAFRKYNSDSGDVLFLRRLSPTAESLGDRTLEPLMKKHGRDVQYVPLVNGYPER